MSSNEKFYEAIFRNQLPISKEYGNNGWPALLYPFFLAHVQRPDADMPGRKAFTLAMGDDIRIGVLPAVRQRIPWFIEDEIVEPHLSAQQFAAWLAKRGEAPSPLTLEWFASQGVNTALSAARVVAEPTDDGEVWKVKAREQANEIVKRQRAKDLHPNQLDIAGEIAREFRKVGIVGTGGKPLTGASIKRHALKGISSAQGRLLSTSKRQSK